MGDKIRVCHICSYYENILFHNIVSAQEEFSEPTVFFFKPMGSEVQYGLPGIDEVNCFTQMDRFFFFIKEKKVYGAYKTLYQNRRFDLNFAHSLFANGYIAYRAYQEQGTPYIIMVQNTDLNVFFKHRLPLRRTGVQIALCAERIVFASESYRKKFLTRYIPKKHRGEIEKKTLVIPYSIEGLYFDDPAQAKRKTEKTWHVLCAGLICENKNQIAVARAVERLRQEGMDIQLTFVGQVKSPQIKKKLEQYPFVTVKPFMEKEALKQEYRDHDLFALASKTETFGLVYAEALSQGLPILYSKGEGFDGQFQEGYVGYAVNPEDVADIAEGIRKIVVAYPELAKNTTIAADRFRMSLIAQAYRRLYSEVGHRA